jgi:hypothetical protein
MKHLLLSLFAMATFAITAQEVNQPKGNLVIPLTIVQTSCGFISQQQIQIKSCDILQIDYFNGWPPGLCEYKLTIKNKQILKEMSFSPRWIQDDVQGRAHIAFFLKALKQGTATVVLTVDHVDYTYQVSVIECQ